MNQPDRMDQKTIEEGMRIAQEALLFALWSGNTATTTRECRIAIKTLFGEEVDAALAKKFCIDQSVQSNTMLSGTALSQLKLGRGEK